MSRQKSRRRKPKKSQRAFVGMSLEDIKKKKAQKPELRQQARDLAAKESKTRQAKKPAATATKGKSAAPKAGGGKKDIGKDKAGGKSGAGAKLKYQGSR